MRTSAPARGRGETDIVKLCEGRGLSLARSRDLGDTGHCTAGHGTLRLTCYTTANIAT